VLAAVATILPGAVPKANFWKHGDWYNQLGRAGRELLDVIFVATRFGESEIKYRDFELAKLAGKGIRWVQKGLWQLLHQLKAKDGDKEVEIPIIDRFHHYGRKEDSYRVIKIIAPEMLPQEKTEPAPNPSKKPRKPRRPVNATSPLTPEEEKLHAENMARAAAEAQQPESGDEAQPAADVDVAATLRAIVEASKKEQEVEKGAAPKPQTGPNRPRISAEEMERRRAAARARTAGMTMGPDGKWLPADPPGPPDTS
jgi:hypothetical protein